MALLPVGHDPDSYIREKGVEELNKLIDGASPLPEFVFDQLVKEHGLTLDGKRLIVEELKPLVRAAASPLHRSVVLSHFAKKLDLPLEDLKGLLVKEMETISTLVPKPPVSEERLQPLTSAQDRLVRSMVLYPAHFHELEQKGCRACLEGTIGEVLFLHMKSLLKDGK